MMMDDSKKMHRMEMNSSKIMHNNMSQRMGDRQEMEAKDIWNSYCPITGGEIALTAPTVEYKGKTIGFCCPGCNNKFMDNPEKYMKN